MSIRTDVGARKLCPFCTNNTEAPCPICGACRVCCDATHHCDRCGRPDLLCTCSSSNVLRKAGKPWSIKSPPTD